MEFDFFLPAFNSYSYILSSPTSNPQKPKYPTLDPNKGRIPSFLSLYLWPRYVVPGMPFTLQV